jgi:hypothetical protein
MVSWRRRLAARKCGAEIMPRIAVALGVLAAAAFCIGFNTVRYPVVWEMLNQAGVPRAASTPADGPSLAALTAKPSQPSAKSTQSAGSASKTAADAGKRSRAAPDQADCEHEFCTADGLCQIATGPQPGAKKGSSPAPKSGADHAGSPPGLPRDASLDGLKGQTRESSLQPPASGLQPPDSRLPSAAKLARVERPLVPVPDGPPASPVQPLPPVDESAAAASGPAVPQPAGASTPFYPTTGLPAFDLSRFKSGKSE